MTSPSSPANPNNLPHPSEDELRPWFRAGAIIQKQHANEDARQFLQTCDLIHADERHYVKCVNEDDGDYFDLEPHQRDCDGKIYFEPGEERTKEYTCDDCGRVVGTVQEKTLRGTVHKTHFVEYWIHPDWERIWSYACDRIKSLDVVDHVENLSSQKGPGRYSSQVNLQDGRELQLVLADIGEAEALYKGAFFGSPTLYIQVDPNKRRETTMLEDLQILRIETLTTATEESLVRFVEDAATPVKGFTDYEQLSTAFDQRLATGAEEEGTDEWSFLEQELVPQLLSYVVEHPEATDDYLNRLRKVSDTMLGHHHVPFGGSGNPDMLPVPKFPLMKQFVENASVGEAKRYRKGKSTFGVGDYGKHLRHIRKIRDVEQGVVFLTSNDVSGTVWGEVTGDYHDSGKFRVLILTRYLLLEFIDAIGAYGLLGVERQEDGSLVSKDESGAPVPTGTED